MSLTRASDEEFYTNTYLRKNLDKGNSDKERSLKAVGFIDYLNLDQRLRTIE